MRLISEVMTAAPQTIGSDQRLDIALAMMRGLEIRHLPVLEEGRLVGMISDGDVPETTDHALNGRVSERMSPGPYTVTCDTSLDEVAQTFARLKCDVVVVIDPERHVLGVFTTVDLARALVTTLGQEAPGPSSKVCDRYGHLRTP